MLQTISGEIAKGGQVNKIPDSIEELSKFVGNTPLIQVFVELNGKKLNIFAKYACLVLSSIYFLIIGLFNFNQFKNG